MSAATRRDALRRAALAAGGLVTPALLRPAIAYAREEDDEAELADFLIEAVALEQVAVVAYRTAVEAGGLGGLGQTLRSFAAHEEAHAVALRSALDSVGIDPPDPPRGPRDRQAIEGVGRLDSDRATAFADLLEELAGLEGRNRRLEILDEVENDQILLYLERTPGFESEDLLRTGVEIAACQAQHVVVLREALGAPPAEAVPELPTAGG